MTRILVGDALERLRELPDGSVHCCVTSPPYWGLRRYEGNTWEGGDPSCDHKRVAGSDASSTLERLERKQSTTHSEGLAR